MLLDNLGKKELNPWEWQTDIINRASKEIGLQMAKNVRPTVMIQSATGTGKTVIASCIIKRALAKGKVVWFVAESVDIVAQTAEKLESYGVQCSIVMGGYQLREKGKCYVGTIQTLHSRSKTDRYDSIYLENPDLIFVDEAHRSTALRYYQAIYDVHTMVPVVGLSATPIGTGKRVLSKFYNSLVCSPPMQWHIENKYLLELYYFGPEKYDLTGVALNKDGDYNEKKLDKAVNKKELVGNLPELWLERCEGRPTVVFAASVAHAMAITECYIALGIPAEFIYAETPRADRDAIKKRLEDGITKVAVSVGVLIEGWDCRIISCIQIARPTKSISLWIQMVGRAARTYPGQTNALIFDHTGSLNDLGRAEDYDIWDLEQGVKKSKNNKVQSKEEGNEENSEESAIDVVCPGCFQLIEKQKVCPACGFEFKRFIKKDVPVMVDGELVQFLGKDKKGKKLEYSMEEKQLFYSGLIHWCKQHNRKPGFAYHKFKDKFGIFPANTFNREPLESEAVNRWMVAEGIKYRKRKEKEMLKNGNSKTDNILKSSSEEIDTSGFTGREIAGRDYQETAS